MRSSFVQFRAECDEFSWYDILLTGCWPTTSPLQELSVHAGRKKISHKMIQKSIRRSFLAFHMPKTRFVESPAVP